MSEISGFTFPFRIDSSSGAVSKTSGPAKIRDNIRVLLNTRLGERPMIRDYGTKLHALVHEPNDSVLGDLIKRHAQEALLRWEPRVFLTGVQTLQEDGELRLELSYSHTDAPLADRMLVPIK